MAAGIIFELTLQIRNSNRLPRIIQISVDSDYIVLQHQTFKHDNRFALYQREWHIKYNFRTSVRALWYEVCSSNEGLFFLISDYTTVFPVHQSSRQGVLFTRDQVPILHKVGNQDAISIRRDLGD